MDYVFEIGYLIAILTTLGISVTLLLYYFPSNISCLNLAL